MQQASVVRLSDRLREAAATRGEEVLAEIPGMLRRLRLLLLVLAISLPMFLAGCLAVLAWYFVG
jgi:hypothetical protein